MSDDLRSQRLEWLHARCLKAADDIPGARFFALRTDDELLNDTLNGRDPPATFPISLFDFDWGDAAKTLSYIAFEWQLAFPVATDISKLINEFFDATSWYHEHDLDRDIEYLKDSGFWLPRWSSDADDHSDWTSSDAAEHHAEVTRKLAAAANLQKWAIEAFVSRATGLAVSLPNARYGHFKRVEFNGQKWIGVALDRSAPAAETVRQQRLIELRLDEIWQDARDDLKEQEWSIDVALAMSTPSVRPFGSVSVCAIEENLFVAFARALAMLGNKDEANRELETGSSEEHVNNNEEQGWWPTDPPPPGYHDTPVTGTRNELAHCVGLALHGKKVDVNTLCTMHRKTIWVVRSSRTSWQAYFRTSKLLAEANAAIAKLRKGIPKRSNGTEADQNG